MAPIISFFPRPCNDNCILQNCTFRQSSMPSASEKGASEGCNSIQQGNSKDVQKAGMVIWGHKPLGLRQSFQVANMLSIF